MKLTSFKFQGLPVAWADRKCSWLTCPLFTLDFDSGSTCRWTSNNNVKKFNLGLHVNIRPYLTTSVASSDHKLWMWKQERSWRVKRSFLCHWIGLDSLFQKSPSTTFNTTRGYQKPKTIDVMMKKKNSWVGVTSWYHYVAEDSRIPKLPIINRLQALVHPQTQKKTILHGLSIPNHNFSEFAFFGKYRSAD
jgi:hypothetical protein